MRERTVDEVVERVFGNVLGAIDVLAIAIGDRLGYYTALASGPRTADELAHTTNSSPRYAREWLEQQTISGIVHVDDASVPSEVRRYGLDPATCEVLATPGGLAAMAPLTRQVAAAGAVWQGIVSAARSGGGLGWEAYGADMRESQAELNAAPVRAALAQEWIPAAFPRLHERLTAGESVRVADVGAGAGWASVALAEAYPSVRVDAFDIDPATIAMARDVVEGAGVADRVSVVAGDVAEVAGVGAYDLVMAIECIHDMPDPVGVLRSMRSMVVPGGCALVVDERVADEFAADADDVERLMYGFSILVCLPDSMATSPSAATGTVMRRPVLEAYAQEAGFASVDVLPVEHDMWRFYSLN